MKRLLTFILINLITITVKSQIGPIGGGQGYSDLIDFTMEYELVHNYDELINALQNKKNKIYIEGGSEIIVPIGQKLYLHNNLTIASNRGINGSKGGMIKFQAPPSNNQFGGILLETKNVTTFCRISGIRFQGLENYSLYDSINFTGIYLTWNAKNVIIDNCELWGFKQAIKIATQSNPCEVVVKYNYIHDNIGRGGYGVAVNYDVSPRIMRNVFDNNWHSIAATGEMGQGYIAEYNLILQRGQNHSFDVHGYRDITGFNYTCDDPINCPDPFDACNYAGTRYEILNNTFIFDMYPSIKVRGIPTDRALIMGNKFSLPKEQAIKQELKYTKTECANLRIYGDLSDPSNDHMYLSNNVYNHFTHLIYCSWSGKSSWKILTPFLIPKENIKIGDFNGDNISDIFYADGEKWFVSYNGVSEFTQLNVSTIKTNSIGFGDFDGNGKTDIIRSSGGKWYVSFNGISSWQIINSYWDQPSNLAFEDFNGDGKTDVFKSSNGQWMVSYSGTSEWQYLNTSDYTLNDVKFGYFNMDDKVDIVRQESGQWSVSYGGVSDWTYLNTSDYSVNNFVVDDFDGDSISDILIQERNNWYVSYAGITDWTILNTSSYGIDNLMFGDFDGDQKTDILRIDSYDNSRKSGSLQNDTTEIFNEVSSLDLFPNPVQTILNIKSKSKIKSIEVYNIMGQTKLKKVGFNNSIDLSSLKSGIYFIRIECENGFLTEKALKVD